MPSGKPSLSAVAGLERQHGETEIVLSVITIIELEHGLYRARTAEQAQTRRAYLDTVFAAIPVEPFTTEMARIAARIDAEARQEGRVIAFADLLIGATAIRFGYGVATRNLRHFQLIPNVSVLQI
jgi:predicted nucleic acid-binding protein